MPKNSIVHAIKMRMVAGTMKEWYKCYISMKEQISLISITQAVFTLNADYTAQGGKFTEYLTTEYLTKYLKRRPVTFRKVDTILGVDLRGITQKLI